VFVHPELTAVIELQQVDRTIAEFSSQIEALPAQIKTLQAQLEDFIHAHEERKTRLTANQKERKELEGDIKVIQEKISKHKDQLYQVKTNEQYRAMLKEIEGEEANIRKIEDHILEKMIESEDIQKRIQEAAARLDGEKARVAAETKRMEAERQKDVEDRDRLLALAEVRDGFCTGCNVTLRPQFYNEVRTNEAVVPCENCGRILYYVEPVVEGEQAEDKNAEATA
jgi:predicted  nucleic acid-binding Zn-ribbon protein